MKKSNLLLSVLSVGGLALALSAPAQAQESTPPPAAAASGGGGSSFGGGGGNGIGVGAAVILSGTAFPAGQFVYDQAMWHLEGLFGFASAEAPGGGNRTTEFIFGAGGWYHLSRGSSSDFSLGGLIAVDTTSGPGPSTTITSFEPGATIRAFITPNVALSARGGLAFRFGDTGGGTEIALSGQPTGAFGFTYFFR